VSFVAAQKIPSSPILVSLISQFILLLSSAELNKPTVLLSEVVTYIGALLS
jgi:hypothetical protein